MRDLLLLRLARRPLALTAIVALAIVVVATVSADLWARDPNTLDAVRRLQGPSLRNPLGTDNLGRDILSRIVYGARISLIVGALVAGIAVAAGTVSGLIAGYYRKADMLLMRFLDGLMAFPSFLLAVALVGTLGAGLRSEVLALSIAYWPIMTRVVRSSTLQFRNGQLVEAAVASGTRGPAMLFRQIFPNVTSPIIIQGTFVFAESVLLDASLSFLGLGVAPPTPTWGNMLADSRSYLGIAPWFALFPGLMIVVAVMALNIFGDALRDELDPQR